MPLQVVIRRLDRLAVERLLSEAGATRRVTFDSYRGLLVVVGADAKPETAELLQTLADADALAMQEDTCPPKP